MKMSIHVLLTKQHFQFALTIMDNDGRFIRVNQENDVNFILYYVSLGLKWILGDNLFYVFNHDLQHYGNHTTAPV